MHLFNGYDIELTRGDSLFFKINLDGRTLPEGSVGYFTVKKTPKSDEIIIQKKLDASDGVLDIRLTSEDTYIPVRTYYWDVRVLIPLADGGYEVETPMEYAAFTILDAIGYPGDAGQNPGTDADLPVLSLLIEEARSLIEKLNNFEIPDEQIDQSVREYIDDGYFAPAVMMESTGDAISGAAGINAKSVLAEIKPRTEIGAFAPDEAGGVFMNGGETVLTVNGNEYHAQLPDGVYAGSFNWATGEVVSTAYVVDVSNYAVKDSGTSSAGLKYVAIQNTDFSSMLVCNRYIRNDSAPYEDKSVRLTGVSVYIYDSGIDLDNPSAILQGLEFLLPLSEEEKLQVDVPKIELETGDNVVSADTGDVTVTYAIDTKTYIDEQDEKLREQIGQLSAEMSDKVTSPSVAEVGQVIAVKAVDENGNPTEWEAIDPPEGGGSADAVLYTEQTLTDEQKNQAIINIGSASAEEVKMLSAGIAASQNGALKWDGVIGDRAYVSPTDLVYFVHVSDEIPTIMTDAPFASVCFVTNFEGPMVEAMAGEITAMSEDGLYLVAEGAAVIIPYDNYTMDGFGTFPKKGVYFQAMNGLAQGVDVSFVYVSSLMITGYTFSESGGGDVSKYFETSVSDTLTWDGNTEGMETFFDDATYRIYTGTIPETLLSQEVTVKYANGGIDTETPTKYSGLYMSGLCYIVPAATSDGIQPGVYFGKSPINGNYVTSLTIPGASFKANKLKAEYLPNNIVNVQPDWNQTNETAANYIKNKPELYYFEMGLDSDLKTYRLKTNGEIMTRAQLEEIGQKYEVANMRVVFGNQVYPIIGYDASGYFAYGGVMFRIMTSTQTDFIAYTYTLYTAEYVPPETTE